MTNLSELLEGLPASADRVNNQVFGPEHHLISCLSFRLNNRVYSLYEYRGGGWKLSYQPINAKTGKPWQASRGVCNEQNAYRLSNWKTRTNSALLTGTPPSFEEWSKTWTGLDRFYITRQDALSQLSK